jgi:putative phosphoribosyl transferase
MFARSGQMMTFASREEAGRKLGDYLKAAGVQAEVVLGLPRGGVVVAAEVARIMQAPLDVLVVRKVGHPLHREFAVGALAENGVVLLDQAIIARNPLIRFELDGIIREETERLQAYKAKFHRANIPSPSGKRVLLVDDGIATGATTQAAVMSVRKLNPERVIVAAPVASLNSVERLARVADEVHVLCADAEFEAVGSYYTEFAQTTDEEVLALLQGFSQ